ncbi:polysaccharide pyruvyl transferase family protein [uncultured Photobacterium sp.]|uniref:polysaccharide pyruvyl transferase family protein n=1 Tax=uncultured Photobacterium sp. TaxID=173973 RepID=UPI002631CAAF|nr:polysaccharide pyruvyl transferase family protein [uncultured Photobacterium sp.]
MAIKILSINECHSDNLGDQAISKSINYIFNKNNCVVINADYSCSQNIKYNNISSLNKNKSKFNLLKKIKALKFIKWAVFNYRYIMNESMKDVDFAVIGGGQLILSNSHFPISIFLWTFFLSIYKKNIYLYSVGCGEKFSFIERILIKYSLKKVKIIFVRDQDSKDKLKLIFNIDSIIIPDVAYALFKNDNYIKDNFCVLGVVDYNVYNRYKREINRYYSTRNDYYNSWIDEINEINCQEIILSSTTLSDRDESISFYEYAKDKTNKKLTLISKLQTLDEYFDLLSKSSFVISGRMHSLILGECYHCSVIPWFISKKIISYQKERNHRNINLSYQMLDSAVKKVLDNETKNNNI